MTRNTQHVPVGAVSVSAWYSQLQPPLRLVSCASPSPPHHCYRAIALTIAVTRRVGAGSRDYSIPFSSHFRCIYIFIVCVCFCTFTVTCSPACQNGGTCQTNHSTAHCACPRGYTGSYCQSKGIIAHTQPGTFMHVAVDLCIIPCDSHQSVDCSPACQNGGTCHYNHLHPFCICPRRYTGVLLPE